jgi:hypothetical protein
MRGTLGMKYGFEVFMNQNVPTHTTGRLGDATGALTSAGTKGDTDDLVRLVTSAGTFKKGDTFVIAGNTQRYVFTEDKTADRPARSHRSASRRHWSRIMTISRSSRSRCSGEQGSAFTGMHLHSRWPRCREAGNNVGARIATVTDPVTNLSLRSRIFYDGDTSSLYVSIDALWGVKTLDPNLACRLVN